jgi:hypothetical protein
MRNPVSFNAIVSIRESFKSESDVTDASERALDKARFRNHLKQYKEMNRHQSTVMKRPSPDSRWRRIRSCVMEAIEWQQAKYDSQITSTEAGK